MVAVHRHGDARACGATTTVTGQSTVFVNNRLVAVEGDPETHGEGDLVSSSAGTIIVNGKKMIVISDIAIADNAPHPPPATYPIIGSSSVNAY